jgi:pimeloyl-ACP methyl ester carboxylesterase
LVHETSLLDELYASISMQDNDLATIKAPVLAIYGENSDIAHNAERMRKGLPNGRVQIFAGCTHSVLWEQTEALRDVILEALQDMTGRPPASWTSQAERRVF